MKTTTHKLGLKAIRSIDKRVWWRRSWSTDNTYPLIVRTHKIGGKAHWLVLTDGAHFDAAPDDYNFMSAHAGNLARPDCEYCGKIIAQPETFRDAVVLVELLR